MMTVLIIVLLFVVLDLAAQRWGCDSREREHGPELLEHVDSNSQI
jgi:hypothetical protein